MVFAADFICDELSGQQSQIVIAGLTLHPKVYPTMTIEFLQDGNSVVLRNIVNPANGKVYIVPGRKIQFSRPMKITLSVLNVIGPLGHYREERSWTFEGALSSKDGADYSIAFDSFR
jgi:hypothetical protein